MIIVPMREDFGHKLNSDQTNISFALQAAARSAGLAGQVVTVWDAGAGRMGFRGPMRISLDSDHPFRSKPITRFA
jgi:hypothetical protein